MEGGGGYVLTKWALMMASDFQNWSLVGCGGGEGGRWGILIFEKYSGEWC